MMENGKNKIKVLKGIKRIRITRTLFDSGVIENINAKKDVDK